MKVGIPIGAATLLSLVFVLAPLSATAMSKRPVQMSPDIPVVMVSSYYAAKQIHDIAHNQYPIGTKLTITNPENGLSSYGIVAGTGPFIKGRQLDVSTWLAQELGFKGKGVTILVVRVASTTHNQLLAMTSWITYN